MDLRLENLLNSLENGDSDESLVEKLEEAILLANSAYHSDDGDIQISDAIYDSMIDKLTLLKPDSEILSTTWENAGMEVEDAENIGITGNPMFSIQTVKRMDETNSFFKDFMGYLSSLYGQDNAFDLHLSMKLNGHAVRVYLKNGVFHSAHSRARSSNGRSWTEQIRAILNKQGVLDLLEEEFKNDEWVELRGEVILPLKNLEKARTFNPSIVSAFSGVSSMSRESATKEEWELLTFIPFRVFSNFSKFFKTKHEEYEFLEDLNFEVPAYRVLETTVTNFHADIEEVMEDLTELYDTDYGIFCDGVVCEVNSREDFESLGTTGRVMNGNIALKVGTWKQEGYFGYLQCIEYTEGKSKLSPVAIIADEPNKAIFECNDSVYDDYNEFVEDIGIENLGYSMADFITNKSEMGVLTASGNRVTNVPLYQLSNVLILGLEAGSLIYFNYGGEAGVVPTTEDGLLLTDIEIE